MQWPVLQSEDLDVDEFYEEFESVCGFANDMRGLFPLEKLLALKQSLRGSRHETYENIKRQCQENGTFLSDPEGVYEIIKGKLLGLEKHLRKNRQWRSENGAAL